MSKDWTDKLPSLLEEYEASAPEGLWDAVQAGMATRKKRVAAFWWFSGGILSAAAAVALAVFLWKPAAEPALVSSVPETRMAEVIPEDTPPEIPVVGKPVSWSQKQTVSEELPEIGSVEPETIPEKPGEERPEQAAEPEALPEKPVREERAAEAFGSKERKKPASAGKIQLRLSSGAYLAQAANELLHGYGVSDHPGMTLATKSAEEGEITVPMLSRNRESSTEASHRQLFRAQIAVTYPLSARWSVGSGIAYSLLQSEYSTVSGETRTNTIRQLHYLGVPLTVQFKAFEFKRLSVVLEAGPMFQAAVGSNERTLSHVGDKLVSRQLEYPAVKDLRWSLNAGMGLQYQLFRSGGLFVQPGISWHFAGSGNVESVYSLQPVSFDLSFGYRFTF